MQAILQRDKGGVETLYIGQTDRPKPAPDELLVEVHAAGVNRADILQREGRYAPPLGVSAILGLEVAGIVVEIGEQVQDFAVGDEVFGLVAGGGYAQYVCLDSQLALPKPQTLSATDAASLPEAWMTAWLNLVEIGHVAAGQLVCIHAGASGVGLAAIQLVKYLGAKVMATVGNTQKAEFCQHLGADVVVNYKEIADFATIGRAKGGVDLVLDCIGGSYFQQNIHMLNQDGKLISIAFMGGRRAELDFAQLVTKRLTIQGSTLRNQPREVKVKLANALRENIIPLYAKGTLKITIDRVFPWHDVKAAHTYMESNQNIGKIVLDFGR
jgi:NADPH2:quinone reductase